MCLYSLCSQSRLVAPCCRPLYESNAYETKKTDFALAFSSHHPLISQAFKNLGTFNDRPTLSQMDQASTSRKILYMGCEVKAHGGSESEAQAQIFYWLGAGIIKKRVLFEQICATSRPMLPLLGATTIGHAWKCYIAFGIGNNAGDPIQILGPLDTLDCSTTSWLGKFRLLQLLERIEEWARDTCWNEYCDVVLPGLKAQPMSREEAREEQADVWEAES